jgi:rfaE bifunctional protein nucleotidyltransferase chain/domain
MTNLDVISRKVRLLETAHYMVAAWRVKGARIIFTNGVFDILHKGHITLLAEAAALGSKLIVGLNSDASVRTLGKGPNRPINSENDRAIVLASLQMVDSVIIFDEPTPYELIKLLSPDVIVKGGDYNPKITDSSDRQYIVGSDLQRANGRETIAINLVDGYSTTSIVNSMSHG